MIKKILLSVIFLNSFKQLAAQQPKWQDTVKVIRLVKNISKTSMTIPKQDSVLQQALDICNQSNLLSWKIRLLNFWSQQKISQNEISDSYQKINEALACASADKNILKSVDYRDAVVQMSFVQLYKNNLDSTIYWCKYGAQLAHNSKDFFNESVMLSQKAISEILKNGNTNYIDSLLHKAELLSLQTATKHDDAMVLHNKAAYLKAYPKNDLKKSLETLLAIQNFAQTDELENNRTVFYQRCPFFFRGTHILLLRELAYGYFYLGDFAQSVSYMEQISKKFISRKNFNYLPHILVEQAFFETYIHSLKRVGIILDSANRLAQKYQNKIEIPTSFTHYVKGWLSEQKSEWKTAIQEYKTAIELGEQWINQDQIALFRIYIKASDKFRADSMYAFINSKITNNTIQFYKIYFDKELPAYFKLQNNNHKALIAELGYYKLKDSLTGISAFLIANRYEKEFKTKEKDRLLKIASAENEVQQKQLTLRNRQTVLLLVGLMLLFLAILLLVNNVRLKKKQTLALEKKNEQIQSLIRELHHRVKNNLQVVSGLLSLQSNRLEDETAKQAMDEGRSRVDAMALIHQKLYMDDELAGVDIKNYLEIFQNHWQLALGMIFLC